VREVLINHVISLVFGIYPSVQQDHRLKRTGHPVRSAIHKLVIQWIDALNRANRHSVESEPLAALRGEQGERGEATQRFRVNFVSVSRQFRNSTRVWPF
jgi:hypothetical protein